MILNNNKISKVYLNSIFFIVTIIILQLSFNYNFFHAASDDFFENHQKDSEALVVGKIISSKYENIFNDKSMGKYTEDIKGNYEMYYHGIKPNSDFISYYSSFGLQGYIYSGLDKLFTVFNIASYGKLSIMHFLTALGMSLSFAIFILLVKKEFGFFPAIVLLIMITYSQWLIVFAKNLYWIFFLNILPFVIVWWLLKNNERNQFSPKIYYLIFLLILIKSLCGFEYLSTIFISIGIPLIYFSILNNWSLADFIRRSIFFYISAFLGFFTSIFIYIIQKYFIFGSLSYVFEILRFIILKRTYGNSEEMPEILKKSLESDIGEVILKYWYGEAFDLKSIFGQFTVINFDELIIFFVIITICYILSFWTSISKFGNYKKQSALFIATWVSILAPLSWYILAKGHSYIHITMNHVLWYIPFLPLVFITIGSFIINMIKSKRKFYFSFFMAFFLFSVLYTYISDTKVAKYFKHTLNFNTEIALENPNLKDNLNIQIKMSENKLIYFYNECANVDLSTTYFLHIYPTNNLYLSDSRKKYGFENMDFNWQDFEIKRPNIFSSYRKSCLLVRELPIYPIKSINTGQYNAETRLWETTQIELNKLIAKNKSFNAFDLTDNNWNNGISRSEVGFFIENNFINRHSLSIGDKLKFNKSGIRVIENIDYSKSYINIFLSGNQLDAINDGYPNKIELIENK